MLTTVKQTENQSTKPTATNGSFFGEGGSAFFFQAKLTVNQPGDEHEREADAVADQVMRMKSGEPPIIQRMPITPVSSVQRACSACENDKEKEGIQRKENSTGEVVGKTAPSVVSEVLSSGGSQPMDGSTRQFMESRFGQDFSQVRIHTDTGAAKSASAIQARAYTSGRDVVFGSGEYQPSSQSGQRLLAHELVHVGQQNDENTNRTVQRTIEVGGETFSTAAKEKDIRKNLEKKYKDEGIIMNIIDIIYEMEQLGTKDEKEKKNTSKTSLVKTEFNYNDLNDLIQEAEMRYNLVLTMTNVETSGTFGYGDAKHIDKYYWEPLSKYSEALEGSEEPKFRYNSNLTKDSTPAKAVDAIFSPTDNKAVILECNSMMTAIQYKSMLDTFGSKEFNKMFKGGRNLIIGPLAPNNTNTDTEDHNPGTDYPDYTTTPKDDNKKGTNLHPFIQSGLYDLTTFKPGTFTEANPPSGLAPGDWVYFLNHEEYADYAPLGDWSGEHAMYLGNKRFTGFGLTMRPNKYSDGKGYTFSELISKLQQNYEGVYSEIKDVKKEKRMLTQKEIPGITVLLRPKMDSLKNLSDQ